MTEEEEIAHLKHIVRNYRYLLDLLRTRLQEMEKLLEMFE